MARIYGVQLPSDKPVAYALTYLYGIGLKTAQLIIQHASISDRKRVKDLSKEEEAAILREIADRKLLIEGDLRKKIALDIQRLREIKCYRGTRHLKGLPVRGQRTKTNARTRKGPRKAGGAVALKRKVTKK
jgi:small subunit ribosomal protein S13